MRSTASLDTIAGDSNRLTETRLSTTEKKSMITSFDRAVGHAADRP
jgi:hypothetical protein